jgi:DNA mismatch repair ATPase MutS
MKNFIYLSMILFFFSCQPNDRQKIEKEKERLRIEAEAKKELLNEELDKIKVEEDGIVKQELDIQIDRFFNSYNEYNKATTEIDKLEKLAMLEVVTNRIIGMKNYFPWLENISKNDYEKLKEELIKYEPSYNSKLD